MYIPQNHQTQSVQSTKVSLIKINIDFVFLKESWTKTVSQNNCSKDRWNFSSLVIVNLERTWKKEFLLASVFLKSSAVYKYFCYHFFHFFFKQCHPSHKKLKDSLEGSLDWVLLWAELEFPKILVPRLHQLTSNLNIEFARRSEWSKRQYSLCVISFFLALTHLNFIILILICF